MLDIDTQLSDHLTLRDFTRSVTAIREGIDNILPDVMLQHAQKFAKEAFEPVRKLLGDVPLPLDSGFRSIKLNDLLPGASETSQHMLANAMDIAPHNIKLLEAFKIILSSNTLVWDQLFIEGFHPGDLGAGWIHYSYNTYAWRPNTPDSVKAVQNSNQTTAIALNRPTNRQEIKIVTFSNEFPKGKYLTVNKQDALAWCDKNA